MGVHFQYDHSVVMSIRASKILAWTLLCIHFGQWKTSFWTIWLDKRLLYYRAPIDTDLVEFGALAHDLGHPPFGHNDEKALDQLMYKHGGFEGNAQTLRILAKLAKKTVSNNEADGVAEGGVDHRLGLDVSMRSLASVLKYDNPIPEKRKDIPKKVVKGYYFTEKDLVAQIKHHVAPRANAPLKTIECSVMDIADDIAYSTYDLEDTLKAVS